MAGLEVSEDEMWDVVLGGNVSQIEAWVRDGLDLARWRSKIGDNIYHYCVIHSSCYGALCVAESVPRLCHTHVTLLTQPNDRGQTPFVHACYTSSGHDLAMMEFLIHHNPSINYDRLLSSTLSDQSIIRYLVWRLKNPSGLPKEISRLQNTHILSFIETVEGMDNLSAKRYLMSVQEQAEKSCNIRLIFLGYQGVGKTSLLLRLTGQDLSNLESTNQVDVYHNLVIADMETKTRRLLPKKQEHDVTRSRLRDVIIDSVSSYHDQGSRKTVNDPKNNDITSQRSKNSTSEQSNAMKEEPEVELRSEAGAVLTVSDITTVGSAKSRVYVSMFDFGGEIMFSNFQHIFLNTNSVILLCFSLHDIFEEDKILDRVFFWLKFLSTFAPSDKKYCPPVVLIGTHLDKVPQEERIDIKDRVKTQLLMEPTHATAYQRHVLAFEVVNNISEVTERVSKSGNISADELRQNVIENQQQHDLIWERIFEAAKYQSHWNQILPAKWLLLERDLMILKSQGKKIITLSEVNIRAKQLSVPLEDVDVKAMLSYLHETRRILCFQLDHPDDVVILDIQFIVEAFRLIVTDLKFHKRKTNIDPAVQHEYGNSRLTMAFIRTVWEQKSEFHGMTDTLLFFLERLELLVKPLPIEGEMTVDYFIVPYLLDESDPTEIRKLLHDQVKRSTLCFDFQGRFIPPAVYNKILASCIHRFSVLTKTGGGVEMYLQQGLACFVLSPRWKLILHCKDSIMKITLFSDTIILIEAGDGFNIRCIMEEIIATTLDRNQQGHLKFRYSLSSDFEVTINEEMIPVDITTETVPSVGTEAAVWCRVQNQTKQTLEPSILDTIPSSRELIRIAKNIGTNYSMFFVELGLDTRQVERIRLQHERRRDFLSIWTTILLAWKDKLGPRATLRHVQKSMTFCGFDSTDLLHTIKTLRKPGKVDNADDVKIPSNYRPQANELSDISMLILKAYFIVFIELGVTKSYIDLVEMEEPNPISMITQLLSHWMDTQTEANAQQLYLALQECETNSCCDFIEMMRKRIQP